MKRVCGHLHQADKPRPGNARTYGLKLLRLKSFIALKCFRLLDVRVKLFSTAVAAIIASPDRSPDDNVYSSI